MTKLDIDLSIQDSMIFFTSDLHLGHKNIIEFCHRPFIDIKDMSIKLIDNWNSIVRKQDIVFLAGDIFWFNDKHAIKRVFNQLNGTIYIIPGNHDKENSYTNLPEHCILLNDIVHLWIKYNDEFYFFAISHYPLLTYRGMGRRNTLNLHGHIHSGPNSTASEASITTSNHYDIGVDNNMYRPVSLTKIINLKFNGQNR